MHRAAVALFAVLALSVLSACGDDACMSNCPDDRQIVCGTDDVTYNNSCHATCAGEDVQYSGECTGQDDTVDQT